MINDAVSSAHPDFAGEDQSLLPTLLENKNKIRIRIRITHWETPSRSQAASDEDQPVYCCDGRLRGGSTTCIEPPCRLQ